MKTYSLYLFLILLLLSMGCKKIFTNPAPTLPAETHEGKGTFGFNLNGQLWLPKSKGIDIGPALSSSLQYNIFSLAANRGNQNMTFNITNVTAMGTYDLTTDSYTAIFVNDTTTYKCTQGVMNITYFDTQKGIISGIFSLKVISKAGDQISIDQGRFDMTF